MAATQLKTQSIADAAITQSKLAAGAGVQISMHKNPIAGQQPSTISAVFIDAANSSLTVSPTLSAKVHINCSGIILNGNAGGQTELRIMRDAVELDYRISIQNAAANNREAFALVSIDSVAPGTYTYKLQLRVVAGNTSLENVAIMAIMAQ